MVKLVNVGDCDRSRTKWTVVAFSAGLLVGFSCLGMDARIADAAVPNLLPTPKSVKMDGGEMPLTAQSRIIAADPRLKPLAAILSDEIWMITNLKLETATGEARPGDVVLRIDPKIRAGEDIVAVQKRGGKQEVVRTRDFAHTITISDSAVVEGWDYRAVCEGTATMLQAITAKDGKFALPRMKIKDWPHADFTGTMVDMARQWIPIDALKMTINACRLWKVRYIQLHFSDNHAYTFPSKAFPKLGGRNGACCGGITPKVYDLQELKDLVKYADQRGVTLVPELETPGHYGALARSRPDLFGGPGCMNIANEKLYQALDTLVGEMCDVFRSSPYFHIGCDECNYGGVGGSAQDKEYMKKHTLPGDPRPVRNAWELYVLHAIRTSKIVRKYGKMTIAWEGVADDNRLKNDIIVMTWYNGGFANSMEQRGWTVITVPWSAGPLPAWSMYLCNGHMYKRTTNVLGASRPMWQMSATSLIGGYAHGLCERQERTWGPDNAIDDEAAYRRRMADSQQLLDKFALPVEITTEGKTNVVPEGLRQRFSFSGTLMLKLSARYPAGGKIHYTLDGTEPTLKSPVYTKPLKLERSFTINAALFHGDRQLGCTNRAIYEW